MAHIDDRADCEPADHRRHQQDGHKFDYASHGCNVAIEMEPAHCNTVTWPERKPPSLAARHSFELSRLVVSGSMASNRHARRLDVPDDPGRCVPPGSTRWLACALP